MEENKQESKKDERAAPEEIAYQGLKDWIFLSLVEQMNISEGELSVTINSNGIVISGTLIGVREYFDLFSPTIGLFDVDNPLSDIKERLHGIDKMKSEVASGIKANYFHLKNAVFYGNSIHPFPISGALWRGKISEVSGFSPVLLSTVVQ
ncbi:hypothetical protein [Mucilaginibacter lappiensis]|uniref:Gas vesicle protein n=1 Tax=Mucilaginibacter lappiensis TaxID=354630 RepID=A0A841JM53_9SPHI|nr:hypothetical protein [Mucilaginibacter lappiensis]MBB6131352.1 hypothetical protein [Mucilaginibacter lappiensis]